MAANSSSTNSGRKNYYNVSYGKISTKMKNIPENYSEIAEADLKAKIQNVEQVDLRSKYVNKGTGDYPYNVFFDSLTGVIQAQEKHQNDNNINLNLTILDNDGDISILQVKFYSKYAENLLNRLLNTDVTKEFTFFPYAIPAEAEINGVNRKFYNQGISLNTGGNKIEGKYKADNEALPPIEQVTVSGKTTTSRDKRLDFLYAEFASKFTSTPTSTTNSQTVSVPTTSAEAVLPF